MIEKLEKLLPQPEDIPTTKKDILFAENLLFLQRHGIFSYSKESSRTAADRESNISRQKNIARHEWIRKITDINNEIRAQYMP